MGNQVHGGRIHCTFCGGKTCKHEDFRRQGGASAIDGLHSSWVTPNLLAMQRPSTRIIKEHDVLAQFKKHSIGAVINCQIPNEHAFCGDGIDPRCGYSYCAEDLAQEEIHFYEFGWIDMSVPSLERMMNIVQVVDYVIRSGRKVAVHCHAGLGRTGLVIACYMMYADKLGGIEAREAVRAKRPGSVQSKSQEMFLLEFEELLARYRLVFPDAAAAPRLSLEEALERQRAYLHGEERRLRRRLPKIVDAVCGRLQGVAAARLRPAEEVAEALARGAEGDAAAAARGEALKVPNEPCLLAPCAPALTRGQGEVNSDRWGGLEAEGEPRVLAALLLSWLEQLKGPLAAPPSPPAKPSPSPAPSAGPGTETGPAKPSGGKAKGKGGAEGSSDGEEGEERGGPSPAPSSSASSSKAYAVRRAARPVLEAVEATLRSVSVAPEGALRAACRRLAGALAQAAEGPIVDALAADLEAAARGHSHPADGG
eukprot:tig00020610_g12058.t1